MTPSDQGPGNREDEYRAQLRAELLGETTPIPPPPHLAPTSGGLTSKALISVVVGIGAFVLVVIVIVFVVLRGGNEAPPLPTADTVTVVGAPIDVVDLSHNLLRVQAPFECVTGASEPLARAFMLRYSNGRMRKFDSNAGDNFILCGGSTTYLYPRLASATLSFSDPSEGSPVQEVSGVFGRAFGVGGQHDAAVGLAISASGELICSYTTDALGHGRRFKCKGFPDGTTIDSLEISLQVSKDSDYGSFAGVGDLQARLSSPS